MTVPTWAWLATIGGIAVLVGIDIWHARSPHEVTFREATLWSVIYVAVAVVFGAGLWLVMGTQSGIEYFSGYLSPSATSRRCCCGVSSARWCCVASSSRSAPR